MAPSMPFGCINNVVVAFACHFVAPHCRTFGSHTVALLVLAMPVKISKMMGNSASHLFNSCMQASVFLDKIYRTSINKIGIPKYL